MQRKLKNTNLKKRKIDEFIIISDDEEEDEGICFFCRLEKKECNVSTCISSKHFLFYSQSFEDFIKDLVSKNYDLTDLKAMWKVFYLANASSKKNDLTLLEEEFKLHLLEILRTNEAPEIDFRILVIESKRSNNYNFDYSSKIKALKSCNFGLNYKVEVDFIKIQEIDDIDIILKRLKTKCLYRFVIIVGHGDKNGFTYHKENSGVENTIVTVPFPTLVNTISNHMPNIQAIHLACCCSIHQFNQMELKDIPRFMVSGYDDYVEWAPSSSFEENYFEAVISSFIEMDKPFPKNTLIHKIKQKLKPWNFLIQQLKFAML